MRRALTATFKEFAMPAGTPSDANAWRDTIHRVHGNWKGRQPAAEAAVTAAEQRLGVRFPPSYRSFLLFSNGGDDENTPQDDLTSLYGLLPVEEVDWMRDKDADVIAAWEGSDCVEHWVDLARRSLLVGWGDDGGSWLLDPTVIEDGEWAACLWFPGDGVDPEMAPSFAAEVLNVLQDDE